MPAQTKLGSVAIPPIVFQNYPVNIHIRIYREGLKYSADILALDQVRRVPIDMTPDDLKALNRQLEETIQIVASDNVKKQNQDPVEASKLLGELVKAGNYAFKRVFGNPEALQTINGLLATIPNLSFQIATEDFFLPWEIMYPININEPQSFEHFWGMKYVISRILIQQNYRSAYISPVILLTELPLVGLLTCKALSFVVEKEIPFFEKLHSSGKIRLVRLRELDFGKKTEELIEFRLFWSHYLNIAHFACHAFFDDNIPGLSSITLSDDFPITLTDIETSNIVINGDPLIILNACETGNLNPFYTSQFVGTFIRCGARGVVATECTVPDGFAADFAEKLYNSFLLKGEDLGKSLLRTRRYFLEKYNNPTGLVYSLYASPAIRFSQRSDQERTHL